MVETIGFVVGLILLFFFFFYLVVFSWLIVKMLNCYFSSPFIFVNALFFHGFFFSIGFHTVFVYIYYFFFFQHFCIRVIAAGVLLLWCDMEIRLNTVCCLQSRTNMCTGHSLCARPLSLSFDCRSRRLFFSFFHSNFFTLIILRESQTVCVFVTFDCICDVFFSLDCCTWLRMCGSIFHSIRLKIES